MYNATMEGDLPFQNIRALILVIGWPVLIVGSVLLIWGASRFYRDVGKTVVGKLVAGMVVGWFVSMYSLGIAATALMFASPKNGVLLVIPVFALWVITMGLLTASIKRWSREAVTLNAFYAGLEDLVKKRTGELEEAYDKQIQNERELRKLREQFIFIAAHELRTPVTAIEWGLVTMLEDKRFTELLPDNYRRLLESMRQKNKNLLDLVANLLNVARIEKGTLKLESERMGLNDTITGAVESVMPLASKFNVRISVPIVSGELPTVEAHPIYLKEVLINLLTNAIRYNKSGGWVKIEGQKSENEFIINVQDSGIGIGPEDLQNLFKEFYRVKSPETAQVEGTGLGLYITKQLVELMRGRVWVESKKGEGSRFSFSLPLARLAGNM